MTQAELKAKIRIKIRDLDGSKWTDDELDEAVDDALYDPAFAVIIEDDTTTVVAGQVDYDVPATLDVVSDIYLVVGTDKGRLSRDSWEQIADIIRFNITPDSGTLLLVGSKQLTDNISDEKVNLAINLSIVSLYEMLLHKYSTGLLMADITGAEIMNSIDLYERKAQKERGRLHRVTNTRGYKL
jgi:hypothetical protein